MTEKTCKHVYKNETTDWFVAESEEHALELWKRYMVDEVGERLEDYDEDGYLFSLWPDDKPLTVTDEGSGGVTKTGREWADESPCGFLCTTEF